MRILILCTGNSCRSQMAEGFLYSFDSRLQVVSAGTRPEKAINPRTVAVMKELDIDISDARPDPVEKYLEQDFDYVITVCDGAREVCPAFPGRVKHRLHIGFEDPAQAQGSEEEIMKVYRSIRDQIRTRFMDFYYSILPSL